MTGHRSAGSGVTEPPLEIDTSAPHIARIYDYLLGGEVNFAVDREAANEAYTAFPGGIDGARTVVRANRAVLGRVVRYLAGEAGIRQFLDIGTGIPTKDNTHEVAQRVRADARIVYADYDPIVLKHAHKLLTSTPAGKTDYIHGNLLDPEPILQKAADTLDFGAPVALVLFGVLHYFADDQDPFGLVATLMERLAPGSYLAVSHLGLDDDSAGMTDTFNRLSQQMDESTILRDPAEVGRFFAGLDLVAPGIVQLQQWRPDPETSATPTPALCAVGRKP
jgi:S-adenosyl methyltransferase